MKCLRLNSGFTLTEVMVVIALMAVLFAMALPPFVAWRENLNYRQVARGIVGALGIARSQAISTNRQQQLEINGTGRSYRLLRGDRSYGSGNWSSAGVTSPKFPPGVALDLGGPATLTIDYFPNGTSNKGTIQVTDGSAPRYLIRVEPTGRVRLDKVK